MAKHFILRHTQLDDAAPVHALSSLCAGLAAATLGHMQCHVAMLMQAGTPADVVKTRVMSAGSVYRGSWDCLRRTVAAEGLASLWKGFLPTWLRMVRPHPHPHPVASHPIPSAGAVVHDLLAQLRADPRPGRRIPLLIAKAACHRQAHVSILLSTSPYAGSSSHGCCRRSYALSRGTTAQHTAPPQCRRGRRRAAGQTCPSFGHSPPLRA